ncbi:MAG: hypothetical protein ABFC96_17175 [Thermoguttaceae bacterium]
MHAISHQSAFTATAQSAAPVWPGAWRMVLIAVCVLILSSCRNPSGGVRTPLAGGLRADRACPQAAGETLPPDAYTGGAAMAGYPACAMGCPPCQNGQWSPPGLRKPWPEDEYLCDGGDECRPAMFSGRGELGGVEMQDTVATYDTLDGRRVIEPSNKVCVYSPRFGAVRKVVGLVANEERQQLGGINVPVRLSTPTMCQTVGHAKQNVQAGDQIGARPAVAMRTRQGDGAMSSVIGPRSFQDAFKPYENLSIIRLGAYREAEMPFLAEGSNAAIAWCHTQAVQIILDRKGAMATVKYDKTESIYTVSTEGHPRLRLCKIASTASAKPGEEVAFTLRFDNIGDQPIGNVVILDSLSTRLEYIPASAQCSLDAKFSTQPNEGDSVVVRCELTKPLDPCKGGILRFRCRVR